MNLIARLGLMIVALLVASHGFAPSSQTTKTALTRLSAAATEKAAPPSANSLRPPQGEGHEIDKASAAVLRKRDEQTSSFAGGVVSFLPECFRAHEGVLEGVAARSEKDIWAVGWKLDHNKNDVSQPLTLHWDGICWHELPCPALGSGARLLAVAVIPPADAWAVGDYSDPVSGFTLTFACRWDGNFNVWQISPGANVPNVDNHLYGVSGTSRQDLWAVGLYEDHINLYQTLVQHWDGKVWAIVPSPNVGGQNLANGLTAVMALSPEEAWAAGLGGGSHTLIEQWDGKTWTVVASPDAPDTKVNRINELFGIAAKSRDDIWAVGVYEAQNILSETLILRGSPSWRYVPHPLFQGAQPLDRHWLRGVAIDPQDGAWAVGHISINAQGNASRPLITRGHGPKWQLIPGLNVGLQGELNGVSAISNKDVWVVGSYTDLNHKYRLCLIEHWDGNQWAFFP